MSARCLIPSSDRVRLDSPAPLAEVAHPESIGNMTESKFELVDRATGKKSELPVRSGTIGPSVLDVTGVYRDHDAFTFDPGFGVSAACES